MINQISETMVDKAMKDPDNCTQCHGCGRVADSEMQESWLHWLALTPPSDLAVRMGIVQPIECPTCGGTGKAAG